MRRNSARIRSIALFHARNDDAGLMGLLHVEPALGGIPWDSGTDNILSHKIRKKEGRSADAKKKRKKKSDAPYLPSSESVETEPAIISASIIREAPVARAKASTSHSGTSTRGIAKRVTAPRTRNTLFIRTRGWYGGKRAEGALVRSHVSTIECIERCQ